MNHVTQQCEFGTERLSEYVDGGLPKRARRAVEAHVRECAACAALVDDLRRVAASAPALRVDVAPARDLWPGIERRLTPRAGRQRWWRPSAVGLVPRWAAAGALLAVALGGFMWLQRGPAAPAIDERATVHSPARSMKPDAAEAEFDRVAAALEREARARLTMDPRVVDVLEENLATLNVAIVNYREALVQAPDDGHLAARLSALRERKLDMLRQAATLAAEATN